MTHLDESTVQAVLHDELSPADRASAAGHVDGCAACAARLAAAREEDGWIRDRLHLLDAPVPMRAPTAQVPRVRPSWRRAAVIVATLGVVAAGTVWAVPALRSAARRLAGVAPEPVASQPTPPEVAAPQVHGGVAVAPGPSMRLEFEARQDSGVAVIRLVDGGEVAVRAFAEGASFTAGVGRLTIANEGVRGDFAIDLPLSAPDVEVRLGGRVVYARRDGVVTTVASASTDGGHVLDLRGR